MMKKVKRPSLSAIVMRQHHHEEDPMSDDDDPMGLVDQHHAEVVDRPAGYHIEPTEEDMAAASELARRLYWQRSAELLQANDLDGLETLDRNYSWLDFV